MSQSVQAFAIGETSVRQFDGLFSLNDLHRASGSESKHEPNQFTRLDQTQALIAEIKSADSRNCIETKRGANGGTYACRELVIAYAAWISAAFHLRVIRVFMASTEKVEPKPFSLQNRRFHVWLDENGKETVKLLTDQHFVLTPDGIAKAIKYGEMSISEVTVIAEAAMGVLFKESGRAKSKNQSEAEKIRDGLQRFTPAEQFEIATYAYMHAHGSVFEKSKQIGACV